MAQVSLLLDQVGGVIYLHSEMRMFQSSLSPNWENADEYFVDRLCWLGNGEGEG